MRMLQLMIVRSDDVIGVGKAESTLCQNINNNYGIFDEKSDSYLMYYIYSNVNYTIHAL